MWKMMAELAFCWDLSEVNLGEEELSRHPAVMSHLQLLTGQWPSVILLKMVS